MRSIWFVLSAALHVSCATVGPSPGLPPTRLASTLGEGIARLAARDLDEVVRLEATLATGGVTARRALMALQARLGNDGEVARVAAEALHQARWAVGLAIVHGDSAERAAADQALIEAEDDALAEGLRQHDASLVNDAVTRPAEVGSARETRQLEALRTVYPWEADGLLAEAALGGDAAALEWLRRRATRPRASLAQDDFNDATAEGADGEGAMLRTLSQRGAPALGVLERRLARAAEQSDWTKALATADIILALDPAHGVAALVMLAGVERVKLEHGGLTLADVAAMNVRFGADVGKITRLEAVVAGKAPPVSAVASLALRYVVAELPAESRNLAERHLARTDLTASARTCLEAVGAVAALACLNLDTWQRWSGWTGGSPWATARVLDYLGAKGLPKALRALVRDAAARAVLGNHPSFANWEFASGLAELVRARGTAPDVRSRASERLAWLDGSLGRLQAHCSATGITRKRCRAMSDALVQVQGDEDAEITGDELAIIASLPWLQGEQLNGLLWAGIEALARAGPAIDGLAGTRLEATSTFTSLQLVRAVQREDTSTVRSILEHRGALVAPFMGAWARYAAGDIEAGVLGGDAALQTLRWEPSLNFIGRTDPSPSPEGRDEVCPEPKGGAAPAGTWSRARAFCRAFARLSERDFAHAAQELERLLAERDPAGTIAGWALITTERCPVGAPTPGGVDCGPKSALHARSLAASFGHVELVPSIAAGLALRGTDPAAAAARLSTAASRRSAPYVLPRVLFEVLDQAGAPREALVAGLQALAVVSPSLGQLAAAAPTRSEPISVLARAAGSVEDALALGAAGSEALGRSQTVIYYVIGQIDAAQSSAEAAAPVKRLHDWLETAPPAALANARAEVAWMHLLAGDAAAAVSAATEPSGSRFRDVAFDGGHAIRLLAAPSKPRPGLSLAAFKARGGNRDALGELAQALAVLRDPSPEEEQLLCRVRVDLDLADLALPHCLGAWRRRPEHDEDLAMALSYLVLERTDEVRARGLDPDRFFEELVKSPTYAVSGALARNHALWLERQQRFELAAAARRQDWALGSASWRDGEGPNASPELPWRGPLLRARLFDGDGRGAKLSQTALFGLLAGDGASAEGSARAAIAWARPAEDVTAAWYTLDLVPLLALDQHDGLIDASLLSALAGGVMKDTSADAWRRLLQAHPKSRLALALAANSAAVATSEASLALLDRLLVELPENATLMLGRARALLSLGKVAEARTVLLTARARRPNDPRLAEATKLLDVDGGHGDRPDWLVSPDRLTEALAATPDAEVLALEPTRLVGIRTAAELFVPALSQVNPGRLIQASDPDGRRAGVAMVPRPSRCAPLACQAGFIDALTERGFTLAWKREAQFGGVPAAEAMLELGDLGVMYVLTVPLGGRVYLVSAAAPIAKALPFFRLVRESFRPLDGVFPGDKAEAVRAVGAFPPDPVRYQARRAIQAGAGVGCVLEKLLEGLSGDTHRQWLLLDVYLSATTLEERRRVVACAGDPAGVLASELGVPALLEADDGLHRFAEAAIRAHPEPSTVVAGAALLGPAGEDVPAAEVAEGRSRARLGVIQLVGALPEDARRAFVDRAARSAEPGDRAMGLAVGSVFPGSVSSELLNDTIRSGSPDVASTAASVPPAPLGPAHLTAMRARLDATTSATEADYRLLRILALRLARAAEREDSVRLAGLLRRLEADHAPVDGEHTLLLDTVRWAVRIHGLAIDLRAAGTPSGPPASRDELAAREIVASLTAASAKPGAPVASEVLVSAPLHRLLAGPTWAYVRVPEPGLAAAAVSSVARRLIGDTKSDTASLRRTLEAIGRYYDVGLFSDSSGLDLARPLECAWRGDDGWVCAAYVRDAAALRTRLAERTWGRNTGLVLPRDLLTGGLRWAMRLPTVPFELTSPAGARSPPMAVAAEERFRSTERFGDRDVERFGIVRLYDGGRSSVDQELFAFTGDRVFLFTSARLAREILEELPPEDAALGATPEFAQAKREWRDGVTLQGYVPIPRDGRFDSAAVELTADRDGALLRFRGEWRGQDWRDDAVSLLPPGAIAWGPASAPRGGAAPSGQRAGPPVWLSQLSEDGVFGWYPPRDGAPFGRWLWILPVEKNTASAFTAAKILLPLAAVAEVRGVFGVRRGERIVFGNDRDLVERATTGVGGPGPTPAVHYDGDAARPLLAALARDAGRGDSGDEIRYTARIAGLARRAEVVEERTADGAATLTMRVDLRLAEESGDLSLVDSLLASRTIQNALPLPRTLGAGETAAPLAWTFRVEDADALAASRHWNGSDRMKLEVVDAHTVRFHVVPGPVTTATPLSDAERARLLGPSDDVDPTSPEIVRKAKELVPPGTPPKEAAERVLTFVAEHLTYEVTPNAFSPQAVLRRKRGDCTEFSLLVASLLRAAGVPAELREGLSASGDELVAHAWVAFRDGVGWREVEPTAGAAHVGSGHLELPLLDLLAAALEGEFEVNDVTAEPYASASGAGALPPERHSIWETTQLGGQWRHCVVPRAQAHGLELRRDWQRLRYSARWHTPEAQNRSLLHQDVRQGSPDHSSRNHDEPASRGSATTAR